MADVSTRYYCRICRRPYHPKHPPVMVYGEILPCRDCRDANNSDDDLNRVKASCPGVYALP